MTVQKMQLSEAELQSQRKQTLAHTLLIELLSYQFAYPVKWIQTQESFLQQVPQVQRYVEIGPARILANMASKTVTKKYLGSQNPHLVEAQYLSSATDQKQIYYHYEADRVDPTGNVSQQKVAEEAEPPQLELPINTPPVGVSQSVAIAVTVPDEPITSIDAITALVSHKLRKPFDALPISRSIRELSAGKSTLQNEIVGDLGTEFGVPMPEGVEDTPLTTLAEVLDNAYQRRVGKVLGNLIARLISSKMPGGFNQQAVKDYLSKPWGLGPLRQATVLSYASSAELPTRLSDVDAAKTFLDEIVHRYDRCAKLGLNSAAVIHTHDATGPAQASLIDAAAIDMAREKYRDDVAEIQNVLTKIVDPREKKSATPLPEQTENNKRELDEKLKQWTSEFGEDMFTGTAAHFDTRLIREYSSWRNWAKVDLISLIHEISLDPQASCSATRLRMIWNRWIELCDSILKYSINSGIGSILTSTVQNYLKQSGDLLSQLPIFVHSQLAEAPCTTIDDNGKVVYKEIPRQLDGHPTSFATLVKRGFKDRKTGRTRPFMNISRFQSTNWEYSTPLTEQFMQSIDAGESSGLNFSGKTFLITGAGPASIAFEIVRGLLEGGAEVLVTTSRSPEATSSTFNDIYKTHGSKGSKLTLLPFNQGSKQDCEALIAYIYTNKCDIDFVIPFAAIGQSGEIDGLESRSELAHRLMLINVLRLLGQIKKQKESRGLDCRPTHVLLPLSPSHGLFGGDGLYSESKLGLETLFNRHRSENWSEYLSLCGVIIGWTRGTGLMTGNNILAEVVESEGAITFAPSEMAFGILALICSQVIEASEEDPVLADFSGNLSSVDNLKALISSIRRSLNQHSKMRQALLEERQHEKSLLESIKTPVSSTLPRIRNRTTLKVGYPHLSDYNTTIAGLQSLQGMFDLDKVIVIVGFSELGPLGSARTRWEMEQAGSFTSAGFLEMAWIMGLVEHFSGDIKGESYVGWIDTKTKEPVHDEEIEKNYGAFIKDHSGIRLIEPEGLDGFDPCRKEFLHEVVVDNDLPPFEASMETADAMRLRHGDKVSITPVEGCEQQNVKVKKGAHFLIPKSVPFDRKVAGQLPHGWNPAKYGIPDDIISQVDPTTVYILCCVCEALISAGIADPFEIYRYVHVSEIANCLGTGAGGLKSMRGIYRDRYLEKPVQNDILQESFLNTMGAWTNMLLLASSGPIKSPVGACATSVESLDSGCESILLKKAKMAFVGGTDDLQEEVSYEFANMKATANSDEDTLHGRPPKEMSRPNTSTRHGFVESAGCGVQIITSAKLALEMGLPIYGIVAHTQMAGDQIGRSVPAPGQGVLTAAKESGGMDKSPLLDVEYHRRKLEEDQEDIRIWKTLKLQKTCSSITDSSSLIETIADLKLKESQALWSTELRRQDQNLSPMRASLAAWGLTIDDVQVATLHGTSTKANDKNEADVINKQMSKLGRGKGNPLLAVSQKYLTGHPKGAAGAWMLNGGLQIFQTGIVPGNRNADNIDQELDRFEHLIYPCSSIQTSGIKAFMLTSFGFGQKGGIVVAVAPRYLFSALLAEQFEGYRALVSARQQKAEMKFVDGLLTKSLFKAKLRSPWGKEKETLYFLDPQARLNLDTSTGDWIYQAKMPSNDKSLEQPLVDTVQRLRNETLMEKTNEALQSTMNKIAESIDGQQMGIGVDVENIKSIDIENPIFIDRNFTALEIEYVSGSASPRSTLAGRWSAKEAVFKSLGVPSQGPGAEMKDIEIVSTFGVPGVILHRNALLAAESKGITDVRLSISHSDDIVIATAIAIKTLNKDDYETCAVQGLDS